MERQALRRVDEGDLSEDQEERIGLTLMLLEDRMDVLRDTFGLEPGDLNIDLGPLGPLLPRAEQRLLSLNVIIRMADVTAAHQNESRPDCLLVVSLREGTDVDA